MKKLWEYTIVNGVYEDGRKDYESGGYTGALTAHELDEYGKKGWELVQVMAEPDGSLQYIFKRAISA